VIDLAIIAAGRKMEHLEMAAYSIMRSMARVMGLSEAERIFGETLNEEQQSDRKLAQIAEPLLKIAEEMDETEIEVDEEEDEAVLLSDISEESDEEEDKAA
jgi:ferritin-like metal-binding protein YciE